ncbi:MAG: peptidoglycan editing factor PgeF [Mesorhizobium sp.]
MQNADRPEPLIARQLQFSDKPFIRHGFFTRHGGVSDGIYAGLNTGVGSNDTPESVTENRRRVAEWMGVAPDHLLSAYQVHSPDVLVVREPFTGDRPKVDALVTDRPGIAIGASSADCGPVLFADPHSAVIGAAHAGWKGAFTGVLENTIDAMERLGAERNRIVAVLGPSISQANYEVGPEFVERIISANPANAAWFAPSTNDGHAMFDLNGYTLDRLRRAGVKAHGLDRCTYADENLFYSYRRTTHRKEPDYGRHLSAIVIGGS